MEYLPGDRQETEGGGVESKKLYLEDQRKRECLPGKKEKDTARARISASRMMQLMSCAIPFSTEWIYVHLANQCMNLESVCC